MKPSTGWSFGCGVVLAALAVLSPDRTLEAHAGTRIGVGPDVTPLRRKECLLLAIHQWVY